MPIFDDPKKELARLQRELLEEEEVYEEEYLSEEAWLEDELAEAKAMLGMDDEDGDEEDIYRNYANGYGAAPVQPADMYDYDDGDEYEDDAEEALPPRGAGGQIFLTFLLLAGIVAVAAYWVMVLL